MKNKNKSSLLPFILISGLFTMVGIFLVIDCFSKNKVLEDIFSAFFFLGFALFLFVLGIIGYIQEFKRIHSDTEVLRIRSDNFGFPSIGRIVSSNQNDEGNYYLIVEAYLKNGTLSNFKTIIPYNQQQIDLLLNLGLFPVYINDSGDCTLGIDVTVLDFSKKIVFKNDKKKAYNDSFIYAYSFNVNGDANIGYVSFDYEDEEGKVYKGKEEVNVFYLPYFRSLDRLPIFIKGKKAFIDYSRLKY